MRKYLFAPSIVGNGILWIVGLAMQIGGWVSQPIAFGLLAIAFIWSLVTIGYWLKNKNKVYISWSIHNTIPKILRNVLWDIHKQDLKLANKAKTQYIALFAPTDFRQLMEAFSGTNTLVSDKQQLAKLKKRLEGETLSGDQIEARNQIDNLGDKLKPILGEIALERATEIGNMLGIFPCQRNKSYKGIAVRRTEDKKWGRLFNELQTIKIENADIFNNAETNQMVNDYLNWSFAGSSVILFSKLINLLMPLEIIPTEYITSGTYSPEIVIGNRMVRLLNKIEAKVKEKLDERKRNNL